MVSSRLQGGADDGSFYWHPGGLCVGFPSDSRTSSRTKLHHNLQGGRRASLFCPPANAKGIITSHRFASGLTMIGNLAHGAPVPPVWEQAERAVSLGLHLLA